MTRVAGASGQGATARIARAFGVKELAVERGGALQRRTVTVLSIATILGGIGMGASLSVGALLMAEVGGEAISGLSSAMFNTGAAAAGIPLASIAVRRGRRAALVLGSFVAMFGAIVAVLGAVIGVWPVLAFGIAMLGVANAVQLLSRFAATDLAAPKNRARDLSLVVWAITIGAVIGPNLMTPGAIVGEAIGVPPLAGAFVFSFFAQALAVGVNWFGLWPDPLLASRSLPPETGPVTIIEDEPPSHGRGAAGEQAAAEARVPATAPTGAEVAAAAHEPARPVKLATAATTITISSSRRPQLLVIAMLSASQGIMVGLMAMTPLHLMHNDGTPQLVGFTLSLHIAAMYVLSPVFGVMAGKFGRLRIVWMGWLILLASIMTAYIAGPSALLVQIAMALLGFGWGAVNVAGSALLTEITPPDDRPRWQGRSDAIMSGTGAAAGVLAGFVFAFGGFSLLAVLTGGLLVIGMSASLWLLRHARSVDR